MNTTNTKKKGLILEEMILGKSFIGKSHPTFIKWDKAVSSALKSPAIKPTTPWLKAMDNKGFEAFMSIQLDRHHHTDVLIKRGDKIMGIDLTLNDANKRQQGVVTYNPNKLTVSDIEKIFDKVSYPAPVVTSKPANFLAIAQAMNKKGRQAFA